MTDDELRERVARAICREKCAFRGEPPCWDSAFDDKPFPPEGCCEPGCLSEAVAALAAARPVIRNEALEEAAKRYEEDGDWDTFSSAAAAIRALKEKDNG